MEKPPLIWSTNYASGKDGSFTTGVDVIQPVSFKVHEMVSIFIKIIFFYLFPKHTNKWHKEPYETSAAKEVSAAKVNNL